jgi:hypothetical protein
MNVIKRFRFPSRIATFALVFSASVIAPDVAKAADEPCTAATLSGSYGFYRTGNISHGNGTLAAVGITTFDGNGNGVSTQSVSRDGDISLDQSGASTYQLAADCTGKLFILGEEAARLVVVNGGSAIYALSETPGNAVYAIFTKVGKN